MTNQTAANSVATLCEPPRPAEAGDDQSDDAGWLLCRIGSHRFALPLPQVIETMRMLPIEPIASAASAVRGLCIIRGTPTPVIDASLLFDDQPALCERLVTVRVGDRIVALAAGAVLGVQAIATHRQAQLPPLLRNVETISAITTLDEELVFFLNTARMVPDDFVDRDSAGGGTA